MADINHESRAHALLSSSGSSRWMNCTPSPILEEESGIKDEYSPYALEGTLAHELAEINLKKKLKIIPPYEHRRELWKIENHESGFYSNEMEAEVEKYTSHVIRLYNEAKAENPDAILLIEEKVDLTAYIEDGFGTCDDIIISDGAMKVTDLKYGKGVRVEADDNPQLKLYGLGALQKYGLSYDIKTVLLTIVQPRLDHISTFEISVEDLEKWGEEEVKPKAKLAYEGKGKQVPGDWCRFCKVKPICKALADHNLEIAKEEFADAAKLEKVGKKFTADPMLLTDEQVLEIYSKLPMLTFWANAVSDYIYKTALEGKKWEGLKLVEGRSNRGWSDAKEVERRLEEAKFDKEKYIKTSLEGITAIQKLLGKKELDVLLGDLIIKPQGKPVLAEASDPRRAFSSSEQAKEDFKEIK